MFHFYAYTIIEVSGYAKDAWMEQKKELDIEFDRIQKQVWIRGEK